MVFAVAEGFIGTRRGWRGAGDSPFSSEGKRVEVEEMPPNTDIKDGNESGCDGGLVWMGIVEDEDFREEEVDLRLKGDGEGDSLSESAQSENAEARREAPLLHRDR